MHDPTDFKSLATIKKLKLKIETISPLMKLFFALHKEGRIVVSNINFALEGLYQKSSSLIAFVSQFRKVLEIHTKDIAQREITLIAASICSISKRLLSQSS